MPANSPNQINLGNGFYVSDSEPLSSQQCDNCYPNYPETEALAFASLYGTPGLDLLADLGTDESDRGSITLNNAPYFVNGNQLYRLNSDFSTDALGTISGSGRVSLAQNGTQICILVPGGTGYIYSESGGLVTITDPGFRANGDPLYVVYINGYFVFNTDEQWLISSEVNDGLSYNSLDRIRAQVDPDDIVAPFVFKNQLFVFGTQVTEVFQGDASIVNGFPFQRIEGFIIDKGLVAPFAIVDFDNAFVFLGGGKNERPAIWRVEGAQAVKISHTAIDQAIHNVSDFQLNNAFAVSYAQDGEYFASFTATTGTIVYCQTASQRAGRPIWHTRSSRIGAFTASWRVSSLVSAYGKLIAFDQFSGKVGEISRTTYREYGELIRRTFSTPPIDADSNPVFLDFMELKMETGIGEEGETNVIGIERSKNGGKTYGDEVFRSLGRVGEFEKRVIINRMGRVPGITTFRANYSAPFKFALLKWNVGFASG